jgi:leucyl aminopeptidase (aminopeptidase T)
MDADDELNAAARTLVHAILRIAPGERFVAVGDIETIPIVSALERVARDAGAEAAGLRVDQLKSFSTNHPGVRPHKVLPDAVRRAMLSAQASVFVASAPREEQSMRDQLEHIVGACRVRHAHLPGISVSAFCAGLSKIPPTLGDSASALLRLLELGRVVTATSREGTSLAVQPGARRWITRVGRIEPGQSVVLPAGSVIVAPESIEGTFAATASVGESYGPRDRVLSEPVLFTIEGGAVTDVRSAGSPELAREIEAILTTAPGSERVGLVVLGVDPTATEPTGSVTLDQHRPGMHLVIGDPQTKLTKAGWSARTSLVLCSQASSVQIDDVPVIQDGRLLVS